MVFMGKKTKNIRFAIPAHLTVLKIYICDCLSHILHKRIDIKITVAVFSIKNTVVYFNDTAD